MYTTTTIPQNTQRVPSYRPRPSRYGLADAGLSVLQVEIICEARRWVGVAEEPVGSNCGPGISQFNQYYWGTDQWNRWTAKERCQPYCTSFAWFVIDRAVRRLGGKNALPKSTDKVTEGLVWGNAKRTLDAAKKFSGLPVNTTPAVGAVFYRTSTQPGDGSSGHMGIVVSWDGQTLATVEGNQGTSHKVDAYSYPASQLAQWGFVFIHTETITITATKNSAECVPQNNGSSTSSPTAGSQQQGNPTGGSQQSGSQQSGSQQQGNPTGGSQQSGSQQQSSPTGGSRIDLSKFYGSGTQQIQRSAAEICKDVQGLPCTDVALIANPTRDVSDALSIIGSPWMQDDILGGYRSEKYNSRVIRNGSALGANKGSDRQEDYSGWGMFSDPLGNVWYVMNEGHPAFHVMQDLKLFAPSSHGRAYIIPLIREFGGGWKERTAEILSGQRDQNYRGFGQDNDTRKRFYAYPQPPNSWIVGDLRDETTYNLAGKKIKYRNFVDIYKGVLEIGRPVDGPIVVIIGGDAFGWKQAGKLTGQILDFVLDVAGPFGDALGMPWLTDKAKNLFAKIRTTIQALVTSGVGIESGQIVNLLTPIVKSLVPNEIRGYVDQGLSAYQSFAGGDYVQAARQLGLPVADAQALFQKVKSGVVDVAGNVIAQSGKTFNEIRGLLQNMATAKAVQDVANGVSATLTSGGGIREEIIRYGLVSNPSLRTLFSGAGAEVMLPIVPGITEIMREGIKRGEAFANERFMHGRTVAKEDHLVLKGLTLIGMGVPAPEGSLDRLAYRSVHAMAAEAVNRGESTFVLPATVPDEKKECWAAKIYECFNDKSDRSVSLGVLIQGPDPDGVIRLDASSATRTGTVTVARDFDRSPVDQAFIPEKTFQQAAQSGATAIERLVATPTGEIKKEILPITGSTGSSYGTTGTVPNIIQSRERLDRIPPGGGTVSPGGTFIPVVGGRVETPLDAVPALNLKRQEELDAYYKAVAEQEARAQEQYKREAEERARAAQIKAAVDAQAAAEAQAARAAQLRAEEEARLRRLAQDAELRRQADEAIRRAQPPSPPVTQPAQVQQLVPAPGAVSPPSGVPAVTVTPATTVPSVPNAEPTKIYVCPDGYVWDNVVKACVPVAPSQPPGVMPERVEPRVIDCPEGHQWDSTMKACVPIGQPSAQKGNCGCGCNSCENDCECSGLSGLSRREFY